MGFKKYFPTLHLGESEKQTPGNYDKSFFS